MPNQHPSGGRVYLYTFWQLDEIGQHAVFVIDGRDYVNDQVAFAQASEARREFRRFGRRSAELEITEQYATSPRSTLPTWQEYRETLLDNVPEDGAG